MKFEPCRHGGYRVTLDPYAVADFLQKAGVVGLLVFILIGGAKKVWVFGYQLVEMQSDRDRWRDLALKLLGQVDRTAGVADRVTSLVERTKDG
jgi:hypothetical protein